MLSRTRYFLRWLWDYARWRVSRPSLPSSADKIHLGCGGILLAGYTNIDAYPRAGVHLVRDIRRPSFLPNGTVELIYASHVLEHIARDSVVPVLKSWRSILKPGGLLRISVPDFEVLHQIYATNRRIGEIAPPLMGGQSHDFDYHYSVFDHDSLSAALREAGFENVRRWEPAEIPELTGIDWASFKVRYGGSERYLSLNLEAIRN